MTPPYGGGVFIADTSAWNVADRAGVRDEWFNALQNRQIATSPIVALELLRSTRDGQEFDELQEELEALRIVDLSRPVTAAALRALRELAHQGSNRHRLPFQDALIAAAAEHRQLGVLHYDHHFDRLAEVMSFESRWIAPAGSLERRR